MRKLLLATTAILGATLGLANTASAQTFSNSESYDNSTNGTGDSFATPGSVTVRLNGRFRFYGGVIGGGAIRSDSFATNPAAAPVVTGTAGTTTLPVTTTNQGRNKISNYGVGDYARLYPGFDGVAANGLKYGASLEIRQDNSTGAGGGIDGGISQTSRTRNQLYFRREWGYIGTDQLGTIRLGSADGPTSLYLTGTFENYDSGAFQSDMGNLLPGVNQISWPFPSAGGFYSNTKIVYLSPQFFGFDGGISFEPSTATGGQVGPATGQGCAGNNNINAFVVSGVAIPSPGCDQLSSTSTADYARRRNTYEALLRYRGTFGPVGIATTFSYQGSGRVQDSAVPRRALQYQDLSLFDSGLVLTFGGLQVGGNVEFGNFNSTGVAGGQGNNLSPKGAQSSLAFVIGTSYAIGPVIFGVSYVDVNTPGDVSAVTSIAARSTLNQRREQGVNVGGTYTLAPGVSLFAQYQIIQRKQNGFNFFTGTSGASALFTNPLDNLNTSHNKISGQVFGLGSSFAW